MNPYVFVVAEVMDKEPSLASLWLAAAVISLVGFVLVRYCRLFILLALTLAASLAAAIIPELRDPFVGPAIRAEAGSGYVLQAYIAAALAFVIPALGLFARRARLPPN